MTQGTNVATAKPALDFSGMLAVAKELVPTGFLPEHIKTPGQCVAIILAGRELGMEPMLALRSITMVKGRIVVSADAQLALFKASGGRSQFERLDETEAVLNLIHPNGDTHTETFTLEDAKRAGLASKDVWKQYPKAMLRSRCITAGLKSVGFEPTAGAYDPEEAAVFTEEQSVGGSVKMPPGGEVRAALTAGNDDDGSDAPTRDSIFPLGRMKGKRVADIPTPFLEWGVEEGRNLGPDTGAWQQIMRAEIESRLQEHDALDTNESRAVAVGL